MKWKFIYNIVIIISLGLFTACSNNNVTNESNTSKIQQEKQDPQTPSPESPSVPQPPKPITIKYYTNSQPAAMELETELITKKFPHITVETTFPSAQNQLIPSRLTASGYVPDMISYTIGSLWDFHTTGLLSDLSDLIKEYKIDLDRFLPNVVESIRAYSDKQEILFIPHNLSANVLYYNKNLFDKFGVDYPIDDMSWDEIYEIARTMTRPDGDKNYKGFTFHAQNLTWKNQFLQPLIDPDSNKTIINDAGWKKWVETMVGFYQIPGNEQGGGTFPNGEVAMYTGPNSVIAFTKAEQEGLILWDAVSLPYFTGAQDMGTQMIAPFYAISPVSEHRKDIIQIIDYMLSDEVQNLKGRNGLVPIVQSNFAREDFSKDLPGTEGKNLAAFFKDHVGKPFRTTPYDDIAKTVIYSEIIPAYILGDKDINTVFREAEERINLLIQEQLH